MIDLYNEDCLEVMNGLILRGVKVDCILIDPPYGTSACKWDKVVNFDKMWECFKLLRNDNCPIIIFGNEPFSSKMRLSNLDEYKYDWKWEKPSGANFLNFKYQPSKCYEDIMVFGNCPTSYSKNITLRYIPQMEEGKPYVCKKGKQKEISASVRSDVDSKGVITDNKGERYPRAVQKFNKDKESLHPTQKPVELIEYLIKTYTEKNMVVLDCFMGSGTTGVACQNLNRNFIGVELDEKYFDIAKKRINL